MCALIGSYDIVRFKQLVALNSYRGCHSWSGVMFDQYGELRIEDKGFGEFDDRFLLNAQPGWYVFGHIQAPTTEARTFDSIHPAEGKDSLLWHNGILLGPTIVELQAMLNLPKVKWDTELLANLIDSQGFDGLKTLNGSFSCARYTKQAGLHFFRNDISPLFYNTDGDISSTQFEGSVSTQPGVVYDFNFKFKHLVETLTSFHNNEQPFFFIE